MKIKIHVTNPLKPTPVAEKIFSEICLQFGHRVVVLPCFVKKGTLMFRKFPLHAFVKQLSFKSFTLIIAFVCSLLLSSQNTFAAPDGKAIFAANCASCHNPLKDATGPALQGVDKRVPSKEWLYNWIRNSQAVVASGDKYANDLYNEWNKVAMTAFPQLTNEEIDAVIGYVNSVPAPPLPGGGTGGTETASAGTKESGTWLYTAVTFILLLLVLILWRVNSGLKRVAGEKEGAVEKEVPIYRNKLFIAISVILVMIFAGYWMVNGAVNMGRQQNYEPEQPIFYSHKVHAGINQINCLYCHAGAEKSKQAMIPSSNICMNCHKQINEYTGEEQHPLYTAEGKKVNGTEQIQLLYKYAGWNPEKKDYNRDAAGNILATPIKWTKIHNLPDHVYFNHSQHVKVGQVACQQCHGPIQEMDEVYQFSTLSMGWCINCHRQTQVKFVENNYYSIYEKYHKELKDGQRAGVTVEDIGGIECQKCHY
jgi:mono/diheme cytochrome c family protein